MYNVCVRVCVCEICINNTHNNIYVIYVHLEEGA